MSALHSLSTRAAPRDTLVCLHSSGNSGRQWAPFAAALSPHLAVLTPDLLGYGGAESWPAGKPVSLDDEAAALLPLLPAGGAHLLGHSYGGAVALQIALRWPERVKSLTLYEPVRFALLLADPETAEAGAEVVGIGRLVAADALSGAREAAAARFADYWSGAGSWQQMQPRQQQVLAGRMAKVGAEFGALFINDPVPSAAYRGLAMPVQLIGGTQSPLPARLVLRLLAIHCPHALRTTLNGLGHMGPVAAPQRVLEALALISTAGRLALAQAA